MVRIRNKKLKSWNYLSSTFVLEKNRFMNKDSALLQLRPAIEFNDQNLKEIEAFQNNTLRPILKFQNQLILFYFKNYINKREPLFKAFSGIEQKKVIRKCVKVDSRLKNNVIPSILALFTIEEFEFFSMHSKEVSKRIVSMIIQRVEDQITQLY